MKTNTAVLLVGLVVIGFIAFGMIQQGEFSTTGGADEEAQGNIEFGESTDIDFTSKNALKRGTTLSGVTYRLFEVPSYTELSDTDGSDVSVTRGLDYEVLAEKTGFITGFDELTIPTDQGIGTQQINLFERASLSNVLEIKNDDGSVNANGNRFDIGSGQSENIEFEFQGVNNKKFPEGVLVVEVNDSEFDDVALGNAPTTNTPEQHVSATVNSKAYAFEIDSVEDTSEMVMNLQVVAEDGVNPASQDVTISFYDKSYGVDADTGEILYGVEDSDGNDFGASLETATLYLS